MLNRQNIIVFLSFVLLGIALGVGGMALTNRTRPAPIIIATPQPSRTPAPTATPHPSATPSPLTVYINGAVTTPGVYTLQAGSIVQTAVTAAGGFLPAANTSVVNLAQPLSAGAQIYVPTLVESPATPSAVLLFPDSMGKGETDVIFAVESGQLININLATAAELEILPGVGPSTAESIVQYRTEKGSFATLEELLQVSGIGPAKFEQMRDFITVGD